MELAASIVHVVMAFPAWRPHFSFLSDPAANELMALRWLHFIFGIIWIGRKHKVKEVQKPNPDNAKDEVQPSQRHQFIRSRVTQEAEMRPPSRERHHHVNCRSHQLHTNLPTSGANLSRLRGNYFALSPLYFYAFLFS